MSIPCFLWPLLAGLAGLIIGWLLKEFLYRKLKAQFNGQTNRISDLEHQKNDFEGKWNKTNDELSALTKTHSDLNLKFDDLNSNYLSVSNDYDAFKKNNELEFKQYKQQIEDYKRELELCGELKVDFDEKQKELSQLQLKFTEENSKDDTEINSLNLKLKELQGLNTQLLEKAELWKAKAEDNSELDALKLQLKSEQEKVAGLEAQSRDNSELEALNLKLKELQGVNAQLLEKAELWKSKAEDNSELDALKLQLKSEQEKVAGLEAQSRDNSELEALNLKLNDLQGVNAQLLEQAELWKSKAEDNSELDALKLQLKSEQEKVAGLEVQSRDNSELEALNLKLNDLQGINAQLLEQAELWKAKAEDNSELDALKLQLKSEQEKVAGLETKNTDLQNQLADTSEFDLLKSNLVEANTQLALYEGNDGQAELEEQIEVLKQENDLLKQKLKSTQKDDLTKVEGIGNKIAELLNGAGIYTFADLAKANQEKLQSILDGGGSRYQMHNPSTWAKQAALARDGKWAELEKLQDRLDGGVEVDISKKDDLTKVEGIGPKINELLNEGGIYTFAQLAKSKVERLQAILDGGGSRYQMHNPSTWAKQAALARDGKWDELQKWQDELDGGV